MTQSLHFHDDLPNRCSLDLGVGNLVLALTLTLGFVGCTTSEPTEISAATSGYLPTDKKKTESSQPSSATATANATSASTPPVVTQPPKNPSATTQNGSTQTAPALPAFEPGKLDPKIAAKDYMKLAIGEQQKDAPALIKFIAKSTQSLRELMADGQRKLISPELILERGMELSRMKIQASELLEKIAESEDEKAAAALARMEGLSQLTSFGDVIASDELRDLAKRQMDSEDVRIAQQAKSISLSLHVADYQGGTATVDSLVAETSALLSKPKVLTRVNLNSISMAIDTLDATSQQSAAFELARKTEEAYRDSTEIQQALMAWQLYARRTEEAKNVEGLKSMTAESVDLEKVKSAAEAFMSKIDSPWTAFFLVKIAEDMEYTNRIEMAKAFIDVAIAKAEKFKNNPAMKELFESCEKFEQRIAIIGKELDFSGLVGLDGEPINMKLYEGKVVLVDFWASWCGPCLQEIPNIEAVYNKFNKNGFEVIGINIDEERKQLLSFFSSKKLPWSTFVSADPNTKGFNVPIVKNNGIGAIPFIAVIGKDGKVAAIHVRGVKLEGKIAELLAKE